MTKPAGATCVTGPSTRTNVATQTRFDLGQLLQILGARPERLTRQAGRAGGRA